LYWIGYCYWQTLIIISYEYQLNSISVQRYHSEDDVIIGRYIFDGKAHELE